MTLRSNLSDNRTARKLRLRVPSPPETVSATTTLS